MRTGPDGVDIIKKWEGFSAEPYLCPAARPTIGYGSTWDINGDPVTMDHPPVGDVAATRLLQRELTHVEGAIAKLVKVPLRQSQFDALASFIYNVGSGNFQSSTMRMKLNRSDYDGAAGEFWKWRRAGGKILRGLVKRRAEEEALFRRLPDVQPDPVLPDTRKEDKRWNMLNMRPFS